MGRWGLGDALARQTEEAGGKGPVATVWPLGLLTHTLEPGSCAHVGQGERGKTLSQGHCQTCRADQSPPQVPRELTEPYSVPAPAPRLMLTPGHGIWPGE